MCELSLPALPKLKSEGGKKKVRCDDAAAPKPHPTFGTGEARANFQYPVFG